MTEQLNLSTRIVMIMIGVVLLKTYAPEQGIKFDSEEYRDIGFVSSLFTPSLQARVGFVVLWSPRGACAKELHSFASQ